MNQNTERSKKFLTIGLLWNAMVFSYMIRYALGIVAPTLMTQYDFSPSTMGFILSGWNWTYTGAQLLVGPLVDRFGVWIVMGVGSGIWGLSTVALPVATTAVSLFVMRAIFGLGQSMLIPANAAAISRRFDVKERARAIAVSFSGTPMGPAIAAPIAAFILAGWGWQAVFYCLGGGSLLLTLAWLCFYPDKQVGRQSAPLPDRTKDRSEQRIPWISLFRYRSTWGMAFGQMGYLYAFFFFVSWLPGYLVLERGMTVLRTGIVASLPFWAGILGTLGGGWLGDYLIRRGFSVTASRKTMIGSGMVAATVLVITAAFVEQTWLAVTLLTFSVGCLRLTTGSVNSIAIDLAPRSMVGSLTSIQNFFGNTGGLLAPIVTGFIVEATGSFVGALVAAGGMALFSGICYVFVLGKVETLQWRFTTSTPEVQSA